MCFCNRKFIFLVTIFVSVASRILFEMGPFTSRLFFCLTSVTLSVDSVLLQGGYISLYCRAQIFSWRSFFSWRRFSHPEDNLIAVWGVFLVWGAVWGILWSSSDVTQEKNEKRVLRQYPLFFNGLNCLNKSCTVRHDTSSLFRPSVERSEVISSFGYLFYSF